MTFKPVVIGNSIFFSILIFFYGHWQLTEQHDKGGDHSFSSLVLLLAYENSYIYS